MHPFIPTHTCVHPSIHLFKHPNFHSSINYVIQTYIPIYTHPCMHPSSSIHLYIHESIQISIYLCIHITFHPSSQPASHVLIPSFMKPFLFSRKESDTTEWLNWTEAYRDGLLLGSYCYRHISLPSHLSLFTSYHSNSQSIENISSLVYHYTVSSLKEWMNVFSLWRWMDD